MISDRLPVLLILFFSAALAISVAGVAWTIDLHLFYENGQYRKYPPRKQGEQDSLTSYIIQYRETIYFRDTLAADFASPVPIIHMGGVPSRSYVGVPLISRDRVVGVISMQSYRPNAYSPDQVRLLETIATQATIAIENARLFAQMEMLATIDTLTNILNRRQFFLLGTNEIERSIRYRKSLAAIMVDLDFFKKINDTYGHAVGDQVLSEVAGIIVQSCARSISSGAMAGMRSPSCCPRQTWRKPAWRPSARAC